MSKSKAIPAIQLIQKKVRWQKKSVFNSAWKYLQHNVIHASSYEQELSLGWILECEMPQLEEDTKHTRNRWKLESKFGWGCLNKINQLHKQNTGECLALMRERSSFESNQCSRFQCPEVIFASIWRVDYKTCKIIIPNFTLPQLGILFHIVACALNQ